MTMTVPHGQKETRLSRPTPEPVWELGYWSFSGAWNLKFGALFCLLKHGAGTLAQSGPYASQYSSIVMSCPRMHARLQNPACRRRQIVHHHRSGQFVRQLPLHLRAIAGAHQQTLACPRVPAAFQVYQLVSNDEAAAQIHPKLFPRIEEKLR